MLELDLSRAIVEVGVRVVGRVVQRGLAFFCCFFAVSRLPTFSSSRVVGSCLRSTPSACSATRVKPDMFGSLSLFDDLSGGCFPVFSGVARFCFRAARRSFQIARGRALRAFGRRGPEVREQTCL